MARRVAALPTSAGPPTPQREPFAACSSPRQGCAGRTERPGARSPLLRPGPGDHGIDIRPGCHLGAGRRFVEFAHLDGRAAPQGRPAVRRQPPANGPCRRASSVIALTARPHSPRSIKRPPKPLSPPPCRRTRRSRRAPEDAPAVIPHLPKGYGKCGEALRLRKCPQEGSARGESIPGLLGPAPRVALARRLSCPFRAPSWPTGQALFRVHPAGSRRAPAGSASQTPSQGGNALGQLKGRRSVTLRPPPNPPALPASPRPLMTTRLPNSAHRRIGPALSWRSPRSSHPPKRSTTSAKASARSSVRSGRSVTISAACSSASAPPRPAPPHPNPARSRATSRAARIRARTGTSQMRTQMRASPCRTPAARR